jgi:hypothetical protein
MAGLVQSFGARRVQKHLGQKCVATGLVLGPDLSKNFGAGSVQKLWGRECLVAELVLRPEVSGSYSDACTT